MTTPHPESGTGNTVAAEVQAAIDQYYAWFAAGRADLIAAQSYQAPFVMIQPAGAMVLPTPAAVQAGLEATIKPLLADGYARAEMPSPSISVFGPGAAMVSGRYTRYRKDGSVMGVAGGTYLLTKTAAGWRIASFIAHAPDTVIRTGPAAP